MDEQEPSPATLARLHGDTANWNGFMYFSKRDTRLFVPKKHAEYGWTINFGHKHGCILMLFFTVLAPGAISLLATYLAITAGCNGKQTDNH